MKFIISCVIAFAFMATVPVVSAKELTKEEQKKLKAAKKKIPRGAFLLSELEEAKQKAIKDGKPICFIQT
jgi:hypothetical protein